MMKLCALIAALPLCLEATVCDGTEKVLLAGAGKWSAREREDFDEDDVRWAELASELVDRAASHVQSLPGTVTHQAKGRAVEQAKKDVGDARWIVCTRLPPSLQPDLLGRVAAVESSLAQL